MGNEENKKIVQAFFEYANKGDMDSSLALLSDSLVWTDVGTSPFAGSYTGKETVLRELIGPLFSQLKAGIHMTVEKMISEGPVVVVLSSGTAETIAGVAYNNKYCHIITVAGGKITEVVEYCDTALVSQVFGH